MLYIGIDFSISSPCVCFWDSRKQHLFENCEFLTGLLTYEYGTAKS